jgi:hypothetical protein
MRAGKGKNQPTASSRVSVPAESSLQLVADVAWVAELDRRTDTQANAANGTGLPESAHFELISGRVSLGRIRRCLLCQDQFQITVNESARVDECELFLHFFFEQEIIQIYISPQTGVIYRKITIFILVRLRLIANKNSFLDIEGKTDSTPDINHLWLS